MTTTPSPKLHGLAPGLFRSPRFRGHHLVACLLAALLVTGCTRAASPPPTATAAPVTTSEGVAAAPLSSDAEPPTARPAVVARVRDGGVAAYGQPGDAAPAVSLPATTPFGTATVLLVTSVGRGSTAGWLEVALPVRPNGTTGWIEASEVEVREVDVAVEVDRHARELRVRQGGQLVLSAPTAVGTDEHPTPAGTFFVTDKLDTGDPEGPYGPYALGLSAFSEVLEEFAGGDGQIGLHGTNVPASVGLAASHGCLRVDNAVIEHLVRLLPLGTPVTIA